MINSVDTLKNLKDDCLDSNLSVLHDRIGDLLVFIRQFNVDEASQVELLNKLYDDLQVLSENTLTQIDKITHDYQQKAMEDIRNYFK